jgi:shikimate kinase
LPQIPKRNIALTGFMAVGKSAVGRALAKRLKRRFVDLDRVIEKSERMKVKDIFSRKGEAYFRRLEKQKLAQVLARGEQIIATGGGVVMDGDNVKLLREKSLLVCLTASAEVLLKRAGTGAKRPLLKGGDRRERIEELLKQREKNYVLAHAAIDTSDLTIGQIVEKIIALASAAQ